MSGLLRADRSNREGPVGGYGALQGLLLVAGLVLGCGERQVAPQTGAPAPGFELPDLDGRKVQLSDFRGKVVLLNFWATWCPPCVDEMPSLEKLQQALGPQGLQVLAVSIDYGLKEIESFKKEHHLTLTILHDEGARVSHRYQTFKYPESYVISRSGELVEKIIGPRDWTTPRVIHDFVELLKDPGREPSL